MVTIKATSVADSSKFAGVPIQITILITVSPTASSVLLGNTQQFTPTLIGSSNSSVTWSVNGVAGGNSTFGMITNTGLYTAPADLPAATTVTVSATSQADSTKSASASVNVTSDIAITVTTDPSGQPVPPGGTVQLTATVSSSGRPDPALTWLVNGVGNGSPAVGAIAVTGTDTATYTPQVFPNQNPVTITAQSVADTSKKGETKLTVSGDQVLVGAGDIADCNTCMKANHSCYTTDQSLSCLKNGYVCLPVWEGAILTSSLLSGIPGTVFALGDLAYPYGDTLPSGLAQGGPYIFANCYDPAWGNFKGRTRPAPGNHEYA